MNTALGVQISELANQTGEAFKDTWKAVGYLNSRVKKKLEAMKSKVSTRMKSMGFGNPYAKPPAAGEVSMEDCVCVFQFQKTDFIISLPYSGSTSS